MVNSYKDVLLVSEDYIKTNTNISENVDCKYILPAIRFMQHQILEETIGTNLVKSLQQKIFDSTIDDDENLKYKELLDDYILDYLSYLVLAEIIVYTSTKISNFGISRTEDEKQYSLSQAEMFKMKDYYINLADYLKYRLQRYLIANYSDFIELSQWKSIEDLQQNLYSAASCGLFLGGARGKSYIPNDRGSYLRAKYNFPNSK